MSDGELVLYKYPNFCVLQSSAPSVVGSATPSAFPTVRVRYRRGTQVLHFVSPTLVIFF